MTVCVYTRVYVYMSVCALYLHFCMFCPRRIHININCSKQISPGSLTPQQTIESHFHPEVLTTIARPDCLDCALKHQGVCLRVTSP